MGYSTYINITVIHQKRLRRQWELKAFGKILKKAGLERNLFSDTEIDEDSCYFEDNNTNTIEQIVEASKKYPSLLLEADGNGEQNDNVWSMRIQNGKTEQYSVQYVYIPFEKLLTTEERRAARWKASRRSKCTESIPYDPRVGRAMRLIRDLIKNPPKSNIPTVRGLAYMKVDLRPALDLLEAVKRDMMLKNED